MNFTKGSPIANIMDKNDKVYGTIYLDDNKKNDDNIKELELGDGYHFQQTVNTERERDIIYVAGPSGSGKSYYIREYVKQYIKLYPKRSIYLFSYLDEDETLDKIKKIQRIDIFNKEFLLSDIKSADFKDSLVILDDVDAIREKGIKNKIYNLVNQMLTMGRHDNVTVCYACHEVCNRNETKVILNESHSLTIFPKVYGSKKLQYLLESYYGMNKAEIEKFKSLDSRTVTIMRSYPKIVMSERNIYML